MTIIAGSQEIADSSLSATIAHAVTKIVDTMKLCSTPSMIDMIKNGIDTRAIMLGVASTMNDRHHSVIGQTHA
jgi:hypothetical protein